jgi:hypothetical protein
VYRAGWLARCPRDPSRTTALATQCSIRNSRSRQQQARYYGRKDWMAARAFQIEPSLSPKSPQNGNIRERGRRLSAVGAPKITELGAWRRNRTREKPLFSALFHVFCEPQLSTGALPERGVTFHSGDMGYTMGSFAGSAKCPGKCVNPWTND